MSKPQLRPAGLLALAAAALGAAAAAVVLFRFDPAEFGFYPRCPLFTLTGIFCPGCGATRAMHELLHGDLLAAMDYNVFFVFFLPVLLYALLSELMKLSLGRRLPTVQLSGRATWTLVGLFFAFAVLRNLPYAPLTVLAP